MRLGRLAIHVHAPRAALVLGVGAALAACHGGSHYAGSRIEAGVASASGAAGAPAAIPACGPVSGDACARSQPIITCAVENARDLGGVPVEPMGSVACGALFRGPPLADLRADGCAGAERLGLKTVIDLRIEGERLSTPDDSCLRTKFVLAPLPIPFQVSAANYIADFDTKDSMARIFRTLADPAAYPIYFHCTYGRDRTGVVAAAIYLALGASRADILKEYTLSKATVGAFPDSLAALMDEIERRGGIEPALLALGVSAADLAALRARALGGPPVAPSDAGADADAGAALADGGADVADAASTGGDASSPEG